MELDGQAAIVAGARRGIGRAIALELASMGADVAVAEFDEAGGERTAEEVRVLGRRVVGFLASSKSAYITGEAANVSVDLVMH